MADTKSLQVPKAPAEYPQRQRAVQLSKMLYRRLPFWGHPGWLEGTRWRQFVRNQPIAMTCRDTLIQNVLSNEWDIRPRDPSAEGRALKKARDYHLDLFRGIESDFDLYCELISQDLLDLPFGAAGEVRTQDDQPGAPVLWIEHVDGTTLYPTGDPEFPVRQFVQEYPGRVVTFPRHAIDRVMMSPRPELRRKGWGMAPPEKIYLAMEMLYRGDRYYANLLLDTPEAGILDLGDMAEDAAHDWLEEFRSMFYGIDGFKVPVLYEHTTKAEWIPLNRPPIDMIYDKTTLKYAQIVAAGYGLRLSDIGLSDSDGGSKTLAGVIREERQTRRSGYAMLKTKLANHFNRLLPPELEFIWIDQDEEAVVARGRAMSIMVTALGAAIDKGLIDGEEGRSQLVAEGLFTIDLDPNKKIEKPNPMNGAFPFQAPGGQIGPGQAPGAEQQNGPVSPSAGGRGENNAPAGFLQRMFTRRQEPDEAEEMAPAPVSRTDIFNQMRGLLSPAMQEFVSRATDLRLKRLIKAATRSVVPLVTRDFQSLTDMQINRYWLPQHWLHLFEQPNEIDTLITRQSRDEVLREIERHLQDDAWWRLLPLIEKVDILDVLAQAFMLGAQDMALSIVRSLYEEGLASTPTLPVGYSFELVNRRVIDLLEDSAALLVRRIDDGTRWFIKRIVVAGVKQGLASPTIAQGLRDGQTAEWVLSQDGFVEEAIANILEGLTDMTERRTNSITNTEINRVENMGKLEQMKRTGFKSKVWVHLGERGVTEAGNEHPCPFCKANEELGYVPIDFEYDTVFTARSGEKSETPPAHPEVCHCTVFFSEAELSKIAAAGEFVPWSGN